VIIARVDQTCHAYPSQWDAWTTTGRYLYLRFRHGHGTVEDEDESLLAEFDTQDGAGVISLPEFARRAGLILSPDLEL
jgi:hypothetical protein